jgi:hypothetical protein
MLQMHFKDLGKVSTANYLNSDAFSNLQVMEQEYNTMTSSSLLQPPKKSLLSSKQQEQEEVQLVVEQEEDNTLTNNNSNNNNNRTQSIEKTRKLSTNLTNFTMNLERVIDDFVFM